jgi:two-component system cell cycle sensor histidine kinase/response regulator CckA
VIRVHSEPGAGSTFEIYLPRFSAQADVEAAQPPDAADGPHGSETVLLVEDDAPVRVLTLRLLQRHGYSVLQADSGAGAIEISSRHTGPIHLLLADVVMPGISGPELARQLQSGRPELRALFMSGYADEFVIREGIVQDGVNLLKKPFSMEGLTTRVREILDRK